MHVIEMGTYMHAKEACYLCTRPGPLVDTGMQIEGEGILALCFGCIAEAGVKAGVGDPTADAEIATLSRLVENQAKDLDMSKRRETGLRNQLKETRRERDVAREELAAAGTLDS